MWGYKIFVALSIMATNRWNIEVYFYYKKVLYTRRFKIDKMSMSKNYFRYEILS